MRQTPSTTLVVGKCLIPSVGCIFREGKSCEAIKTIWRIMEKR